ncbi:MAG: DUF4364 family protein [Clostridiales bacterium]|nr:DUF4364 family protein [Clostridiales bacterium]
MARNRKDRSNEPPKIKIDDAYKIRILICFLLHNIGAPLTDKQLIEITTEDEMVNYFDLMNALDGIDKNGLCNVVEQKGGNTYSIAENGSKIVGEVEALVPFTIREKCLKSAYRMMERAKNKKPYKSRVLTLEKGFYVRFSYPDPIEEHNLIELHFYADDYEKALQIKEKIDSNPKLLFKSIKNIIED